ncbi:MAG: hypothetical protein U9Q81_18455 [Pseudomonadota bacterium]|nr:hypothetical protein [Pseudomonadota bacterium]
MTSPLRRLFEPIREHICRFLCGQQFFDRDASLEIDRLISDNEELSRDLKLALDRLELLEHGHDRR